MHDRAGYSVGLLTLALLFSCASTQPDPKISNRQADSASVLLKQAIVNFEHAAKLRDLPSLEFLIAAHTYSIGVEEEYLEAQSHIHLFNTVGSRWAGGSPQGEAFLKKANEIEASHSAHEGAILRKKAELWLQRAAKAEPASPDSLREAARAKVVEAFRLHKLAADSGHLPSIGYVAKAYRFGIGVEGEVWMLASKENFYNRLGARMAGRSQAGRDFRARVDVQDHGKTPADIMKAEAEVEAWLKQRPWVRAGKKSE